MITTHIIIIILIIIKKRYNNVYILPFTFLIMSLI